MNLLSLCRIACSAHIQLTFLSVSNKKNAVFSGFLLEILAHVVIYP